MILLLLIVTETFIFAIMKKITNEELNRLNIEQFKKAKKFPLIIVLDNIRSLNNIGSVFRTADGFRIEAVYLCGISACPPHRDIRKTALGATESVNWKYFSSTMDAVEILKTDAYTIISIEQVENAIMLNDFQPEKNKKYALVFGNEVKGVEEVTVNHSHLCIEIPQYGTKHSFNVSVGVGIVLWHFFVKCENPLI